MFVFVVGSTQVIGKIKNLLGYGELELKKIATISLRDKNKALVRGFEQNFMVYEPATQTLQAYGLEGQEKWVFEEKIENPIFSNTATHLYIAERETGRIFCVDSLGSIDWQIDLERTIRMLQSSERGYVAVYSEDEEEKGIVHIFDMEKKQRGKISLNQGYLMDMTLSQEADLLALSVMSIANDKIESNVILYNMEGKLLGGNKYDGDIISRVYAGREQQIVNIGDKKVIGFSKEKGLLWNKEIEDSIGKTAWSEEGFIVLGLVNNKKTIIDTKNRNRVSIIDQEGKELNKLPVKGEVLGIDIKDDRIVAFTDRTLYLLSKDDKDLIEKKVNNDIQSVHMVDKDRLALVFNDKIEIIRVKFKE
ncbi:DUF5711 family protein [Geosporobacter ferrireducens]|uniref:DUF5711 family protein n=1 Tax=Geosporobacter ferrireducens TaxID=1424294 RepID=UPI0012EADC25|nr:DUF5711 family protein [Geosporobacter ferrireducens]MTI57131.1 hypothetical protein [Geosporobacter ferrireducens]